MKKIVTSNSKEKNIYIIHGDLIKHNLSEFYALAQKANGNLVVIYEDSTDEGLDIFIENIINKNLLKERRIKLIPASKLKKYYQISEKNSRASGLSVENAPSSSWFSKFLFYQSEPANLQSPISKVINEIEKELRQASDNLDVLIFDEAREQDGINKLPQASYIKYGLPLQWVTHFKIQKTDKKFENTFSNFAELKQLIDHKPEPSRQPNKKNPERVSSYSDTEEKLGREAEDVSKDTQPLLINTGKALRTYGTKIPAIADVYLKLYEDFTAAANVENTRIAKGAKLILFLASITAALGNLFTGGNGALTLAEMINERENLGYDLQDEELRNAILYLSGVFTFVANIGVNFESARLAIDKIEADIIKLVKGNMGLQDKIINIFCLILAPLVSIPSFQITQDEIARATNSEPLANTIAPVQLFLNILIYFRGTNNLVGAVKNKLVEDEATLLKLAPVELLGKIFPKGKELTPREINEIVHGSLYDGKPWVSQGIHAFTHRILPAIVGVYVAAFFPAGIEAGVKSFGSKGFGIFDGATTTFIRFFLLLPSSQKVFLRILNRFRNNILTKRIASSEQELEWYLTKTGWTNFAANAGLAGVATLSLTNAQEIWENNLGKILSVLILGTENVPTFIVVAIVLTLFTAFPINKDDLENTIKKVWLLTKDFMKYMREKNVGTFNVEKDLEANHVNIPKSLDEYVTKLLELLAETPNVKLVNKFTKPAKFNWLLHKLKNMFSRQTAQQFYNYTSASQKHSDNISEGKQEVSEEQKSSLDESNFLLRFGTEVLEVNGEYKQFMADIKKILETKGDTQQYSNGVSWKSSIATTRLTLANNPIHANNTKPKFGSAMEMSSIPTTVNHIPENGFYHPVELLEEIDKHGITKDNIGSIEIYAINFPLKSDDDYDRAEIHYTLAAYYSEFNNVSSALSHLESALKSISSVKDKIHPSDLVQLYTNIAYIYLDCQEYTKAAQCYMNAVDKCGQKFETIDDKKFIIDVCFSSWLALYEAQCNAHKQDNDINLNSTLLKYADECYLQGTNLIAKNIVETARAIETADFEYNVAFAKFKFNGVKADIINHCGNVYQLFNSVNLNNLNQEDKITVIRLLIGVGDLYLKLGEHKNGVKCYQKAITGKASVQGQAFVSQQLKRVEEIAEAFEKASPEKLATVKSMEIVNLSPKPTSRPNKNANVFLKFLHENSSQSDESENHGEDSGFELLSI